MEPLSSNRAIFTQSGGIRVCAVYPSFAVIGWDQPRYTGGTDAPLMERVCWRYSVEWNCSCLQKQTPFRSSGDPSPSTFAVIPLHHPGEQFFVRVSSKGTLAGSTVGLTTLKTAFKADCSVSFPWLQPRAMQSPLLYHCLHLTVNDDKPEASLQLAQCISATNEGVWRLESDAVVSAYKMVYAECPNPMHTQIVIVLVTVAIGHTAANARKAEHFSNARLLEKLRADDACVVLTGVGELGGSAALATYALLASLHQSGEAVDALARRIYCIAYGAARRCLWEASSAFLEAGCMSGNVLHYTGMMSVSSLDGGSCAAFPNAMFASGLPPALSSSHQQQLSPSFRLVPPVSLPTLPSASLASGSHGETATLNVPLGVRAGPVLESGTNRLILVGEASTLALPTDEEQCECLDTAYHLSLLEDLLAPTSCCADKAAMKPGEEASRPDLAWEDNREATAADTHDLQPRIVAITHELADRASLCLRVYLGGCNLHYNPCVTCLTSPGDAPAAMTVLSCSPRQLVCEVSLIPNLCAACFAADAAGASSAPSSLAVSVLVQTDMGFTEHGCLPFCVAPGPGGSTAAAEDADAEDGTDSPGGSASKKRSTAPVATSNDELWTGGPVVSLPLSTCELLFKACRRRRGADAWVTGTPASLIDAVTSSLPFWAFDALGRHQRGIDDNIASSRAIRYMCHLAAAAELAAHYHSRKPQNGLMAFVEKVTARISNQTELVPGNITITAPPGREAPFLKSALKELAMSGGMPVSAYQARMVSWKKRIFFGLPDLEENRYRLKLQWFLLVVTNTDLFSREQPLAALEMQVYSSVLQLLRRSTANTNGVVREKGSRSSVGDAAQVPGRNFTITESLSFSEFFECVHPVFLPVVQAANSAEAEVLLVTEVCFLWAVCVLLQLRHLHTTAAYSLVAVTGCRGSGCTTAATALSAVGRELATAVSGHPDRILPSVHVKQVPENALPLLREVMKLGLTITVFVTAELPDFGGLGFAAIIRSIRGSVTDQDHQQVHILLTKVDERLSIVTSDGSASGSREKRLATAVRAATAAATTAATHADKERVAPIPVSLSPSLESVRAALEDAQCDIPTEDFTAELLWQSIARLRELMLNDLSTA